MKKIVCLLLSLTFVFALTACQKVPDAVETDDITEMAGNNGGNGIANPLIEMTKDEFESKYGATFVPEDADEDVVYIYINGTDIKEIIFTRSDVKYTFRYKEGNEEDISGMYCEWNTEKTDKYSINLDKSDEKAGMISWYYDETNYSISMNSKSDKETLVKVADQFYDAYCK